MAYSRKLLIKSPQALSGDPQKVEEFPWNTGLAAWKVIFTSV